MSDVVKGLVGGNIFWVLVLLILQSLQAVNSAPLSSIMNAWYIIGGLLGIADVLALADWLDLI